MAHRVYLVEDETNLNRLLTSYLEQEGWHVTPFLNGESARLAISQEPDLWILDIMLPDIDGYQLINEIKMASPGVPVSLSLPGTQDWIELLGLKKAVMTICQSPSYPGS